MGGAFFYVVSEWSGEGRSPLLPFTPGLTSGEGVSCAESLLVAVYAILQERLVCRVAG